MKKFLFLGAIVFIIFSIALAGCIRNPADYQEYVISSTQQVINNPECTCFICTNSTGSWFKDIFVFNDLSDGSCDFKPNCSRGFVYYFLTDDEFNYIKDFGIGQGSSYTEFEESNRRCDLAEEYVVRILYSKYRPPLYDSTYVFSTSEAKTVECSLEKGVIPIYIFYTRGTYVQHDWIGEFMDQTDVKGAPVFISPEAFFTDEIAENVTNQIKAIYDNCDVKRIEDDNGKIIYKRGCKIALLPAQDTDEEFFRNLDSIDKKVMRDKVSAFILNVVVDKNKYMCDSGYALAEAMNRSRFALNKYAKPSFLIFSIDTSCSEDADKIAEMFYTSIPVMRTVGIFGAAYSQYSQFDENLFNNNKNAYSTEDYDMWLKLCKYYHSPPYKKEPIIYQSDGVNITTACDYASIHRMDAIKTEDLNAFDSSKVDLKDSDYKVCISEVDFGDLEDVAEDWDKWDDYDFEPSDSDCTEGYPGIEMMAERCGLNRHLLRALHRNNIMPQSCDEWYDFEKELNDEGIIDQREINPSGDFETELGKTAFLYVLKKDNEGLYEQVVNALTSNTRNRNSGSLQVTKNTLYSICNENTNQPYDPKPCKVLKEYSEYKDKCDIDHLTDWIKDQG